MQSAGRLSLSTDVSAAAWVVNGVGPYASGVGGLLPRGFEAYARILHPAISPDGSTVRWATVAAWSGTVVHPLVQFASIARPGPAGPRRVLNRPVDTAVPFVGWPPDGDLPAPLLAALCEVLEAHTATPQRCWFCLWEGWGWASGNRDVHALATPGGRGLPWHRLRRGWHGAVGLDLATPGGRGLPWHLRSRPRKEERRTPAFGQAGVEAPRVRLPNRDYVLFEGPLGAATELGDRATPDFFVPQSPNLFWPDDRAWCVATEIDLDSTFVGGSAALIAAILADPRFEAWPAEPSDPVDAGSDRVNPAS